MKSTAPALPIAGLNPETATHGKGRERVAAILAAAEELLVEEGVAGFSLRNVAARAGLKMGNIQYYFRTKEDLTNAIMDAVARGYTAQQEALIASLGDASDAQRFDSWLHFLLDDARTPRTQHLFAQLWALADTLGAGAAPILRALYDEDVELLARLITGLDPTASAAETRARAAAIASMIEGTMIVLRNCDDRAWQRAKKQILRGARAIARGADPESPE